MGYTVKMYPSAMSAVSGGGTQVGWTTTGGATSLWQGLNEDPTNASRHSGAVGDIRVAVADYTLPTYAKILRVRLHLRTNALPAQVPEINAYISKDDGTDWAESKISAVPNPTAGANTSVGIWNELVSNWLDANQDGNEWTQATLNSKEIRISVLNSADILQAYLEAEIVNKPALTISDPVSNGLITSLFHTFKWLFNPNGDFQAQKKYEVKVWTAAQVAAGGWSVDTSPGIAFSGQVRSSRESHNFDVLEGGSRSSLFAPGVEHHVYIKVAKDFHGSDFWSDYQGRSWFPQSVPTFSVTTPTPNTTTSRPTFTFTYGDTGGKLRDLTEVYVVRRADLSEDEENLTPTDNAGIYALPAYHHVELDGAVSTYQMPFDIPNGQYDVYTRAREAKFGSYSPWDSQSWYQNTGGVHDPSNFLALGNQTTGNVEILIEVQDHKGGVTVTDLTPERSYDLSTDNLGNWHAFPHYTISNLSDAGGTITPLAREWAEWQSHGLRLSGASGNNASTANKAYFVNIRDIKVAMRTNDWTPAANQTVINRGTSWVLRLRTDGKLEFLWSTNGGASFNNSAVSTVVTGITDTQGKGVRVVYDDVANPYTVKFYLSPLAGDSSLSGAIWTQLGATISPGGATTVFNSGTTGSVYIGSTAGTTDSASIDVYEVRFDDGPGSMWDRVWFGNQLPGTRSINTGTNTWAINGSNTGLTFWGLVVDYCPEMNSEIRYRVLARGVVGAETRFSEGLGISLSVTPVFASKLYLKTVETPQDGRHFPVMEKWLEIVRRGRRGEFWSLGAVKPKIMIDPFAKAERFRVSLLIESEDDIEALFAMIDEQSVMVVQSPKRCWFAMPAEDITVREHLWDIKYGLEDIRAISILFQEVEGPSVSH